MLISKIIQGVNHKLAGEMLTKRELIPYLDQVIDDINTELNTIFPAFSELPEDALEYTCFPDRYIRNVVILGAAHYFYMTDEEGGLQDAGYYQEYKMHLFYMLRDYISLIPPEYRATTEQGKVGFNLTGAEEYGIYAINHPGKVLF